MNNTFSFIKFYFLSLWLTLLWNDPLIKIKSQPNKKLPSSWVNPDIRKLRNLVILLHGMYKANNTEIIDLIIWHVGMSIKPG